MSFDSKVQ